MKPVRAKVIDAGPIVQKVNSPDWLETLLYQALTDLRRQTVQRIASGLDRKSQPAEKPAVRRAKFINPPPMTAPSWFQDRYVETKLIGGFLRDGGLRLLAVVGRGGVGKTAMVCRLLKTLEAGRLPDDGGELPVDAIVYLSPAGIHPVSFANLFADLTRLLPDATADRLQELYRDPEQTPAHLMRILLEEFPDGRSILLLDNLANLGESYADLEQTEQAIEHYRQALAIFRETGGRGSEGFPLTYLGNIYSTLGHMEQAIECYQQALQGGDGTGTVEVQAGAYLGLAHVHLAREEWLQARQTAQAALRHRHQPLLAQAFAALGTAYLREGDRAKAAEAFTTAQSAAITPHRRRQNQNRDPALS